MKRRWRMVRILFLPLIATFYTLFFSGVLSTESLDQLPRFAHLTVLALLGALWLFDFFHLARQSLDRALSEHGQSHIEN